MTSCERSAHINIPRKVNSILKYGSSYYSNGNQSDDSDSDGDENVRRKYINLKSGHGMILSANRFANLDLSKPASQDQHYYENFMLNRQDEIYRKSSSFKHGTRPEIPPIDLDSIQMNEECEYGFNPNRLSGSKGDYNLKLRPISLYSPKPQKIPLRYSTSDATKEKYPIDSRPVSHASNEYEHDLEQELASIRSQPCNLKFQGCEGKINQQEILEDLASSRRNRKIRRQLSFDSHPSRKWHKTMSLDSGLASSSTLPSTKRNKFIYLEEEKSKSQTLLDVDEEKTKIGLKQLSFSAEYIIDDITPVSTPDEEIPNTITPSSSDSNPEDEIKVLPKFVDETPPMEELMLSTSASSTSYTLNKSDKQKRRNIPHILNAFRLPNKKLKKLMRKKGSDSRNSPMKVTHDLSQDVTLVEARLFEDDEGTPKIDLYLGMDNESFDSSVNTFVPPSSEDFHDGRSQSTCSLEKVDEGMNNFFIFLH